MLRNFVPVSFVTIFFLTSASVFSADKLERTAVADFIAYGFVRAATYEDPSNPCISEDEITIQYPQHWDSTSITMPTLYAICDETNSHGGRSRASAELESSVTTNVFPNVEVESITMEVESLLTLDLFHNLGNQSFGSVGSPDATVIADSKTSSTYKSKASQSRTLASTFTLSADFDPGQVQLQPGGYIKVSIKGSDLTAVYMGGYWLVFGELQQNTTSNPNEPSDNVFYATGGEDLNFIDISCEVVAAQSTFNGTAQLGDLELDAEASSVNNDDFSEWRVKGEGSFGLDP